MSQFDTIHPRRGTGSHKWDRRPELDPFWIADMDFQSPPAVIEALEKRVRDGIFGYPWAHPGISEAILEYLSNRHGVSANADHLLHLGGLVPALSLAGRAFAEAGDALLTCTPVYPPFLGVHRDAGLELIKVPHALADEKWSFDWDALEASVTPRTKMFILCHPQNPLGRVFPKEDIIKVAEFCDRHDLVLLSDEIHCDLVLDEAATPFYSALKLPPELLKRVVVLQSPSKTYNIAGLGYAFAVIPDDSLRRKFTTAKGHILPEINCLAYFAAEAAYRHGEPWRQELLTYLSGNRDLLTQQLRAGIPGVIIPDIEATYLALLDFRPLGIEHPAALFEKEAGLFLSPGAPFAAPGHARLNYACPRSSLQDAVDRMIAAVSKKA
jgi:cystathionine beta-lyase